MSIGDMVNDPHGQAMARMVTIDCDELATLRRSHALLVGLAAAHRDYQQARRATREALRKRGPALLATPDRWDAINAADKREAATLEEVERCRACIDRAVAEMAAPTPEQP